MKKILIPAILFTVCIVLSCSRNTQSVQEKKIKSRTGEAESEARERAQWELKRLKDPASGHIPGMMREKELAFAATLPTLGSIPALNKPLQFSGDALDDFLDSFFLFIENITSS